MKLNEKTNLVLRDIYLYDIEACHYNIMKNLGFDMTNIDKDDKVGRNIQIGQMMRGNPRLTKLLRGTTKSILDEYILKNRVQEDEIIIRQYDGMILTRTLRETNLKHTPLDLRKHFQIFIISIDRKSYIALDSSNQTTVKGVSYKYSKMNEIYTQLCRAVDTNRQAMFKRLQKLKDNFLNSKDPYLFGIPTKNDKCNVFLKEYGEMEVSLNLLKIMDPEDIDKQKYFDFYIRPFTKSIVFEYVR